MRLLDARTLKLVEFFNRPQEIPEYAILSHTWGSDEVEYEDMVSGNAQGKAGYQKIVGACNQAIEDKYNFVWVDTCCIQKSSSSELSEAINSMFEWYRKSGTCYAYLEGLTRSGMQRHTFDDQDDANDEIAHSEQAFCKSKFAQHRWFTRGWTLQELIAPSKVLFYGKHWQYLGSSLDHLEAIRLRTGIDSKVLAASSTVKLEILSSFSVAQRMSWAADRSTTRTEDEAYCLMGLFGVNMPLLYGESHAAFVRLQEEIIKISSDQSILAWNSSTARDKDTSLLLAPTVSCFRQCGSLVSLPWYEVPEPFSMTNIGLRIRLHLKPLPRPMQRHLYLAILCCRYTDEPWGPVGLILSTADWPAEEKSSFYIHDNYELGELADFLAHSDGNRTISIAHDGADRKLNIEKEEIILLRKNPGDSHRTSSILSDLDLTTSRTALKFFIHEKFGSRWPDDDWMHRVSIKSLYPSSQWKKTHSKGTHFLSLPSHVTIGAIRVCYKDSPFVIAFGLNGKNFELEAADSWITLQDCRGHLSTRETVQEVRDSYQKEGPYSRKHPSKFTLDPVNFPDDRIEVSLTRRRIWGDVIFVIDWKVIKLTMPSNPKPAGAGEHINSIHSFRPRYRIQDTMVWPPSPPPPPFPRQYESEPGFDPWSSHDSGNSDSETMSDESTDTHQQRPPTPPLPPSFDFQMPSVTLPSASHRQPSKNIPTSNPKSQRIQTEPSNALLEARRKLVDLQNKYERLRADKSDPARANDILYYAIPDIKERVAELEHIKKIQFKEFQARVSDDSDASE